MHSLLTNFQRSHENLHEIRNSRRDSEEFIHPFSPVRRRRTPQPPPKVEVNLEGTDNKVLSNIKSRKEISIFWNDRITTNKTSRRNINKSEKMGESHTSMDDSNDGDHIFNDEPCNTNVVRTYACPSGHTKKKPCKKVHCPHGRTVCDASISSRRKTYTIGGARTMGEVCKLHKDLKIAEKLKRSAPLQDSKELNKWNWLLNWLDSSFESKQKFYSNKNPFDEEMSASFPRKSLDKPKLRQEGQLLSQNQTVEKEILKKFGQKSPTNSKRKLAKNEGADIVLVAERTKPEEREGKIIQKTRSYKKERPSRKKAGAKKACTRKKIETKIKKKRLKIIKKKNTKNDRIMFKK